MINHGSRSSWGPGPSGSRLKAKKIHSNKNTVVFYILSFIMFSPKDTVQAAEPPQSYFGPITPGFVSGKGLGSQDMINLASGKVLYNFIIINFHWKWLTMAPEAHGAQVIQDPDCRPKNMICPH